jgi:hypothetical protein
MEQSNLTFGSFEAESSNPTSAQPPPASGQQVARTSSAPPDSSAVSFASHSPQQPSRFQQPQPSSQQPYVSAPLPNLPSQAFCPSPYAIAQSPQQLASAAALHNPQQQQAQQYQQQQSNLPHIKPPAPTNKALPIRKPSAKQPSSNDSTSASPSGSGATRPSQSESTDASHREKDDTTSAQRDEESSAASAPSNTYSDAYAALADTSSKATPEQKPEQTERPEDTAVNTATPATTASSSREAEDSAVTGGSDNMAGNEHELAYEADPSPGTKEDAKTASSQEEQETKVDDSVTNVGDCESSLTEEKQTLEQDARERSEHDYLVEHTQVEKQEHGQKTPAFEAADAAMALQDHQVEQLSADHAMHESTVNGADGKEDGELEEWEQEEEWEQNAASFASGNFCSTESEEPNTSRSAKENDDNAPRVSGESVTHFYSKDFLLQRKEISECRVMPAELQPLRALRIDLAENISGGGGDGKGTGRLSTEGKSTGTPRRHSSSGSISKSDSSGRESFGGTGRGAALGSGAVQEATSGAAANKEVRTVSVGRTKSDLGDSWAKNKQPPPPPGQRQPVAPGGRQPQPPASAQLHRTENKYKLQNVQDEEDAKQRRFKASLNKITPENYNKLFSKILEDEISSAQTLRGFIAQVIDKSLMEPKFCELYAKFCEDLSAALPNQFGEDDNSKPLTFKRILLNNCQKEFEHSDQMVEDAVDGIELNDSEEELSEPKAKSDDQKLDKILCKPKSKLSDQEKKYVQDSVEFKKKLARRRKLGLMQFIGELYKHQLLNAKIILRCINNLLGLPQSDENEEAEWPDDERVEALCKLLGTIGDKLDGSQQYKHFMNNYFERMKTIADERRVDSRRRFMILDTIDLRKNNWRTGKSNEGPKKIEDVHRDAKRQMTAGASQPAAPKGASRAPSGATPAAHGRAAPASAQRKSALDGPPPRAMNTKVVQATTPAAPQDQQSSHGQSSQRVAADGSASMEHESGDTKAEDGEIVNEEQAQSVGVPDEELASKWKSMLSYLYDDGNVRAAAEEVSSWKRSDIAADNVRAFVIDDGFDRKDINWDLLSKLLRQLHEEGVYSKEGLLEGLRRVLNELPDAVCDLPTGPKHVGQIAAGLLQSGVTSFPSFVDELECAGVPPEQEGEEPMYLKSEGLAVKVLASCISALNLEVGNEKAKELVDKAGGTKSLARLAGPDESNDGSVLAAEYNLTWLEPMIPVRRALQSWEKGEMSEASVLSELRDAAITCGEEAAREAARAVCSCKDVPAEGISGFKAILAAPLQEEGAKAKEKLRFSALDGIVDAWLEGPCGGKAGELRNAFDALLGGELLEEIDFVNWMDTPKRNHGAASLKEVGGTWKQQLQDRLNELEDEEDDEEDDEVEDY